MHPPKRRILLFLVLGLALCMACLLVRDPGADQDASIISPDQPGDQPVTSEPTQETAGQAADPSPEPAEAEGPPPLPFSAGGTTFQYSPLLSGELTAGAAAGIQGDDMPWKTPDHLVIRFSDWPLGETNLGPVIRVYPAAEFRALNPQIGERLDALQLALDSQPPDRTGLAIPEIFGAGQFYQSNLKYLAFQNGRGARWLSQYGQAYFPIGWPQLFYTFQGLTDDGAYYISVILPVSHPGLPAAETVELNDAFYENYDLYRAETEAQLNSEPDASFLPSLVLLDALIESLLVEGL